MKKRQNQRLICNRHAKNTYSTLQQKENKDNSAYCDLIGYSEDIY